MFLYFALKLNFVYGGAAKHIFTEMKCCFPMHPPGGSNSDEVLENIKCLHFLEARLRRFSAGPIVLL